MGNTYRLVVQVEGHQYDGEFYLTGEGYGTAADVFEYVAADHILAVTNARHIESYLLGVLEDGAAVPKGEYDSIAADANCGLHIDVAYQRFSFWSDDHVVEIETEPTASELASIAGDLR